jgi:hypothetical protein
MAVLAVIRNEAASTGRCALPVARIAERADAGPPVADGAGGIQKKLGGEGLDRLTIRGHAPLSPGFTVPVTHCVGGGSNCEPAPPRT